MITGIKCEKLKKRNLKNERKKFSLFVFHFFTLPVLSVVEASASLNVCVSISGQ